MVRVSRSINPPLSVPEPGPHAYRSIRTGESFGPLLPTRPPVCDICASQFKPAPLPVGELSYVLEGFFIRVTHADGRILNVGAPFVICDRCAKALELTPESTELDNDLFMAYWLEQGDIELELLISNVVMRESSPRSVRRAKARDLRKRKFRLFEG